MARFGNYYYFSVKQLGVLELYSAEPLLDSKTEAVSTPDWILQPRDVARGPTKPPVCAGICSLIAQTPLLPFARGAECLGCCRTQPCPALLCLLGTFPKPSSNPHAQIQERSRDPGAHIHPLDQEPAGRVQDTLNPLRRREPSQNQTLKQ